MVSGARTRHRNLADVVPTLQELFTKTPAFLGKLRQNDNTASRALEFAILTATRSAEVYGARWSEIDLDAALWIIPADRMKGGKLHRVPLSAPALAILRKQVKDLPLTFSLDDSLAMNPALRLSTATQVVVGARISKSGNAMPQAGDLQGLSAPVAVGAKDLAIEIAEVVK